MQLSHAAASFLRDTTDPRLNRMLIADSLEFPLILLPTTTRLELKAAFDALWDGAVHPLLAPWKGGPRGIAWRRRAEIELDLLAWVEWQVARKHFRVGQALEAVAQACGLDSAQAIRNSKRRLIEWRGKAIVSARLEEAASIGLMEAAGKDPLRDPAASAHANRLHSLDIRALGRAYTATTLSRAAKVAKPRKSRQTRI